jgi:CHAT domain-containing protein/Flp pilus assembly protein TadD
VAVALSLAVAGAAEGGTAEYLSIRRLLGRGEYAAALSAAIPEVRAEPGSHRTLEALVDAAEAAGRMEEAARVLEGLRDRDPANASAHYALGLVHQRAREYPKALEAFRRAAALAPRFAPARREIAYTHRLLGTLDDAERELAAPLAQDPESAAAHYALGFVHGLRGDATRALAHLDRAVASDPDLLDAYRYAAQLRFRAGDFEGARETARTLGERARAQSDPILEAQALNTQAGASIRLAAYDDAVSLYREALAAQRELGDRQGEWSSLDGLGVAYDNLGQHDKARDQHRAALAAAEPLPNLAWKATTLHNIGVTYAGEGDFPQARTHYFQALTLRREGGDRRGQAYTLRDIGMSHLREGHSARARSYLEEAAAAASAVDDALLHAVLQNALAEAHERSGGHDAARARYEQARAEGERIGYPEVVWRAERGLGSVSAAQERWSDADTHYARAITAIERLRKTVHEPDARMAFLQGRMTAYEEAVALLHRRHQRRPSEGHDRRALEYAERAKARTFLDLLAHARAPSPDDTDGVEPSPFAAFTSGLRRDERLVEFLIGDRASFAWIVGGRAVRMVALPARAALERKVERYRALIGAPPTRASSVAEATRLGRELFALLLGPVASDLAGATRLTIVPDGVLHSMPFESLVRAVTADGRPQYLLESLDVAYAPSASVRTALPQRSPSTRPLDLLAYGDPPLPVPAAHRPSVRASGLAPLLHARREIEEVARLFPEERRRVRLGAEASERAFKREDLSRFRRVHLATHGLIDSREPARSGLLLAAGAASEDGVLQSVEILRLPLQADLVVLSACGSGLGRLVRGEGLVGVTRSFLHAGAQSVIVSLWNIDDESTADLMKGFYSRLRDGAPADRALREAKRDLAASDRAAYRFPYYWAPFVLIGAPSSSDQTGRTTAPGTPGAVPVVDH